MLASPQGSVGVGLSHAARRTWLVPSHRSLLGRWSRRGGRRQQKKQSRQDEDEAEQRTIDLLRDGLTHSFIQRGMNDVFSVVSVLFIIFFSSLLAFVILMFIIRHHLPVFQVWFVCNPKSY